MEITITNDDSLTTYAFLYDVNGKREILRNETRNRSYKLIYPNLKAGTYYLLISSLWDIHYGGYTIENKFIPQNIKGDKEPNDNINNAVDVSIPSVISGTLGYYGNEKQDRDDFFKFHIPQEMDLDIYLTEEPTLITYIFIYNGNKQEIARNDIGVSDYQISLKLKPGTYYIQVNSIGNHLYGGYYIGLNRQVPSLFIETPKKAEEETANIIKITNPINNHTYAVIDKNLSWEEAKDFCENMGGHLATITSLEEQRFIEFLLSIYGKQNDYFLGAKYEERERKFKWVTEEPFVFYNWDTGEPNNLEVEKYLIIYKTLEKFGKWGNVPTIQKGFICEWE